MAAVPPSIRGTYLFGLESSYGTGGTTNKDLGLIQNFTVAPEGTISEHHGQGQAKAVAVKNGLVTPKGTFELEYQHGRILEYAIFGGTTTHVPTSTDITHTLVWAETLPSLAWEASYEAGTTDIVQKGIGLVFGRTTINSTLDGVVKITGDWNAKTIDNSATSVTAAVVNTAYPLGGFECSLSIGGTAVDFVQSWSLTHNPNTKTIHGEGSRVPSYISSHSRNVSFSARIGLSATTDINRFLGSGGTISTTEPASTAMIFAADNGITLGSGKRAITLNLSACYYRYTVTAAKNDFVMYDIEGNGIIGASTCVDAVAGASW